MIDIASSSEAFFFGNFFLSTLIISLISFILYSLSIPKNKKLPPGPRPRPLLGNLSDLDALPYCKMAELAKTYGPLMTLFFGPKVVIIVSSAEMAKEVLQTHDKSTASRVSTIAGNIFSNGGRDIFLSAYGPYWRKVKKLVNVHLFTHRRLQSGLPQRLNAVMNMADIFHKELICNGGVLEIRRFLNQASLNTVMVMTAGKTFPFASVGDPPLEGDNVARLVNSVLSPMGEFNLGGFIPLFYPFDLQGIAKRTRIAKKKLQAYALSLIDERNEQRTNANGSEKCKEGRDFLDVLLDLQGQEDLSKTDIASIIEDIFIAGIETSASTTEWALAELIANPEMMKIVKNELQGIDLSPQTQFSNFKYLQAVIKETYRLHNTTPLLVPRSTLDEIKINNYQIPKNTTIFINAWAIFHDPETWANPMEFLPERFLKEDVDVRGHDFRLIPFGAGRRICPGMNLGHSNVEMMLAVLVKRFEFNLPPGESFVDLSEKYTVTVNLAKPLKALISEA